VEKLKKLIKGDVPRVFKEKKVVIGRAGKLALL
jgi:hypothetical protein